MSHYYLKIFLKFLEFCPYKIWNQSVDFLITTRLQKQSRVTFSHEVLKKKQCNEIHFVVKSKVIRNCGVLGDRHISRGAKS